MSVLALIPARSGSKGCVGKNLRTLGGKTLIQHAVDCAFEAGCRPHVSTDITQADYPGILHTAHLVRRPPELAQDDTPMIAVVQHALQQIPGEPDDIIVLLQPTQPFRTPAHIRQAIALLQESGADSVVSVVPLPLTHSPDMLGVISGGGELRPWSEFGWPPCRQVVTPAVMRDGTVYCFRRRTVDNYANIYGRDCRPLIIDPADSCELDTEEQWAEVERRWKERHGG